MWKFFLRGCRLYIGTVYKKKYQQIYTNNWDNHKRSRRSKKELDQDGIDKEGSLEWLRRGQLNWDGERIITSMKYSYPPPWHILFKKNKKIKKKI